MTSYMNVINTIGDASGYTAGSELVWASTGTNTNNATANYICQTSQVLMLDGYDVSGTQFSTCATFTAIVNFQIANPMYTDDESDVVFLYVIMPSTGSTDVSGTISIFNAETTFDLCCTLSNLGSMVSSPIYQLTSSARTNDSVCALTIPINKWFSFRAPGSTYQIRVQGYTNATSNNCQFVQEYP